MSIDKNLLKDLEQKLRDGDLSVNQVRQRVGLPPIEGGGALEPKSRWRHKKRGSTYVEIGRGKMQAEAWHSVHADGVVDRLQSVDMAEVVVYQSESDGGIWVRPVAEFEDGRFEKVA